MTTWSRSSVEEKVLEVFRQHRHTDAEIGESSQIVADLGIDSLGQMELIADVEDAFKLSIPDSALRQLNTIGDVTRAIVAHLETDGRLQG